jgi:hypothetical protein
MNYIVQITDGRRYAQSVMGRDVRQAEVAVGTPANAFGAGALNGKRPFVGCFNFNGMSNLLAPMVSGITAATGSSVGGPIVGVVAGPAGFIAAPHGHP